MSDLPTRSSSASLLPAGSCCHDHAALPTVLAEKQSRRSFFKLASLGAGAALFSSLPLAPAVAGKAEILLLSCMDYRLVDDTARYMDSRGLTNHYDHVILAGASLGALTNRWASWSSTFWDHLKVAIDLHHIEKVMILDHRDCGAYKVILGQDFSQDPAAETAVHANKLRRLGNRILKHHGKAIKEVELLLMALDGSVEVIPLKPA